MLSQMKHNDLDTIGTFLYPVYSKRVIWPRPDDALALSEKRT